MQQPRGAVEAISMEMNWLKGFQSTPHGMQL